MKLGWQTQLLPLVTLQPQPGSPFTRFTDHTAHSRPGFLRFYVLYSRASPPEIADA